MFVISVMYFRCGYFGSRSSNKQKSDHYLKRIKELEGKLLTSEKRDRVLAAMGVEKPSLQYKRVKALLDQFMGSINE